MRATGLLIMGVLAARVWPAHLGWVRELAGLGMMVHSWRMIPRYAMAWGEWGLSGRQSRRQDHEYWLVRGAFALVFASAAVLIGFADLASLAMVGVGAVAACLIVAGGYCPTAVLPW